jgi:hypothetical protein
MRDLQQRYNIG